MDIETLTRTTASDNIVIVKDHNPEFISSINVGSPINITDESSLISDENIGSKYDLYIINQQESQEDLDDDYTDAESALGRVFTVGLSIGAFAPMLSFLPENIQLFGFVINENDIASWFLLFFFTVMIIMLCNIHYRAGKDIKKILAIMNGREATLLATGLKDEIIIPKRSIFSNKNYCHIPHDAKHLYASELMKYAATQLTPESPFYSPTVDMFQAISDITGFSNTKFLSHDKEKEIVRIQKSYAELINQQLDVIKKQEIEEEKERARIEKERINTLRELEYDTTDITNYVVAKFEVRKELN